MFETAGLTVPTSPAEMSVWKRVHLEHISHGCKACLDRKRTKDHNDNRKAKEEAYKSCGLVKVKGALGGTYWE